MSENEVIIKKFEPKFVSISDVAMELKDKKIDLRKTIEKVRSKDFCIAESCLVIVEGYDDEWYVQFDFEAYSDEYYDKLEEFKDEGKFIYIRAVYANDEISGHSENIYEYEIEDDNYVTVGIASCLEDCDLRISHNYYRGDMESDYGIMIKGNEISFQLCTVGFASSMEPITDLSEPLHELAIEIMLDIIEFKE